ncbi:hypothetical protein ACEWY4_017663 [Coilia grayii]|uniref:CARD domain-containing protein n=1 Tax=Coilia grayii TaxID=363190 RepID=A0ABD1JIM2_9TELE
MDPAVDAAIKEILRNTLDNLAEADFNRFKHYLMDQGRVPWGKLEKADINNTVYLMVKVYSSGAGDIMLTILKKMNQNHLAKNFERDVVNVLFKKLSAGDGGVVHAAAAHSGGMVNPSALSGPVGEKSVPKHGRGKDFFRRNKVALEHRLGLLRPILSELESRGILSDEEREEVENKEKGSQRLTLLRMVQRKGDEAKEVFYEVLLKTDWCLVMDLEKQPA